MVRCFPCSGKPVQNVPFWDGRCGKMVAWVEGVSVFYTELVQPRAAFVMDIGRRLQPWIALLLTDLFENLASVRQSRAAARCTRHEGLARLGSQHGLMDLPDGWWLGFWLRPHPAVGSGATPRA